MSKHARAFLKLYCLFLPSYSLSFVVFFSTFFFFFSFLYCFTSLSLSRSSTHLDPFGVFIVSLPSSSPYCHRLSTVIVFRLYFVIPVPCARYSVNTIFINLILAAILFFSSHRRKGSKMKPKRNQTYACINTRKGRTSRYPPPPQPLLFPSSFALNQSSSSCDPVCLTLSFKPCITCLTIRTILKEPAIEDALIPSQLFRSLRKC
ncbi:hypothetical protein IE53DRAFT_225969 [Violaceomyces palustris]|uniref:Uncharacterized protein n=1 Tax=Violaceomyces palustris TaxID=1673888 RepID=A0ACD0NQ39_9BASI|nr:hypothetical protein IE53DRAFT_225969 [Violaceomyces palustris]